MAYRPDLQRVILQQVATIPSGKVASYGQIARLCGLPGYARYVGTVLKNLPVDNALPWHRVINAQGRIAFPSGSDAWQRQKNCLQQEGIVVNDAGKVNLRHFGWQV